MRCAKRTIAALLLAALCGTAAATEVRMTDPAEVETLLSGATLEGVYLRSQSTYTLVFDPDGSLRDVNSGAEGRWWVNENGEYCREWLTGVVAGNTACLAIGIDGDRIAIYSGENRVAEGTVLRGK